MSIAPVIDTTLNEDMRNEYLQFLARERAQA